MDGRELFGRWLDLAPLHGRARGVVRCRFHEDRRPSFSVDVDRGLFHCFQCGVSGGLRAFAALVGESPDQRRAIQQPPETQPMVRAFNHAEREGRWMAEWGPLFAASSLVRRYTRAADGFRAVAASLSEHDPQLWELLDRAALCDRRAATVEAELDALYTEGPLGLPPHP